MTMLRLMMGALLLSALLVAACSDSSSTATTPPCNLPPVESSPACTAFCAQVIGNCTAFGSTEECCRRGCQKNLDDEYAHADACGEAAEETFLCVSELEECQAVWDWRDQDPRDGFPCRDTVLVFAALVDDGVCLP